MIPPTARHDTPRHTKTPYPATPGHVSSPPHSPGRVPAGKARESMQCQYESRHGAERRSTARRGTARHGTVRHGALTPCAAPQAVTDAKVGAAAAAADAKKKKKPAAPAPPGKRTRVCDDRARPVHSATVDVSPRWKGIFMRGCPCTHSLLWSYMPCLCDEAPWLPVWTQAR